MGNATAPQKRPQLAPQAAAGRTMRMLRETHRIGLREMARLVGVSPSHLSRVEAGERIPGVDLTDRICKVIEDRAGRAS